MKWNEQHTIVPVFEHIIKRNCPPDWHLKKQGCDYHNFMLLLNGHGRVEIDGVPYPLQKGTFLYIPKGKIREIVSSAGRPLELFGVNFLYTAVYPDKDSWKHLEIPMPFDLHQQINHSITYSRLVVLFNRLNTAWLGVQPDKQFRCRTAFMEIFHLLLDWHVHKNTLPVPQIQKVQQIIDYLTAHMDHKITLAQLSEKFKISASHIDYLFRRVTGESPMQYLTYIRINKSKQLLFENYTVTETAFLCGFNDIYYFSRYFKKLTGVAPSNFSSVKSS